MKIIHTNKLAAVFEMKWRAMFSKNAIATPVFILVLTFVMRFIYSSIANSRGQEMTDALRATCLGLGAVMNVSMTGIFVVAMGLAEEKEKHTLRALMTSSVNGAEFFLGSIFPVVFMTFAVNMARVPVAGLHPQAGKWMLWAGVSLLCAAASAIIGMIIGICAKNQMATSTIGSIPLFVLMLIPSFGSVHPTLKTISGFLFTGVLSDTVNCLVDSGISISPISFAVIGAEILLAAGVFLAVYRRNGYDPD